MDLTFEEFKKIDLSKLDIFEEKDKKKIYLILKKQKKSVKNIGF